LMLVRSDDSLSMLFVTLCYIVLYSCLLPIWWIKDEYIYIYILDSRSFTTINYSRLSTTHSVFDLMTLNMC